PDEPARGRKPVLRDELAAVVVKQQYPPERLRFARWPWFLLRPTRYLWFFTVDLNVAKNPSA
ncbi:MAG: hypothetical protein JXA30_11565, partial [Deltaproteobacteria bacterium]|nr:hypothetical protein [Deltaproteobacteria bacterium]